LFYINIAPIIAVTLRWDKWGKILLGQPHLRIFKSCQPMDNDMYLLWWFCTKAQLFMFAQIPL